MPKYLVGFTVPVVADTPEKAAAKFRDYFRIDRELKVTSTDGSKINHDPWAHTDESVWFQPPFSEEEED